MPTSVEDVAHAYFAALADGKDASKIQEWVKLFAPDAVSTDPVSFPQKLEDVHHHDQLGKFVTDFFSNFRTIGLFERQIFDNRGDTAAVQWEGIGVGNNGESVTFHGIDVISLNKDGKIQTVYAFWDPMPVLKAVGAA